jgi:hypothetical protein
MERVGKMEERRKGEKEEGGWRKGRRETKEAWKMGRRRWAEEDGGMEEWRMEEGVKGLIQLPVKYS